MTQPTRATGPDPIGDDTAGRHLAYALGLARALVGYGPDAEDVAAESVARLLARRRGTRLDDPTAYLRRIIVNQVIGQQRRFRTEQRFGGRFLPDASTADHAQRVTDRSAVEQALDRLPRRQRAVLVLRYYEDLPEREIADLLRIPAGTVKSTAARALDDLRRALAEEHTDG